MEKIVYNKLVRDKIPQVIENNNQKCHCEILSDDEYIKMLDEKLTEELKEYQESKEIEELTDMYEVMLAIVRAKGHTIEEFENIRLDKANKRGGFEKKIFLQYVEK